MSHTFVVHSADGPIAEIIYKPSEPNPRTVHYRHHDALGSVSVTTSQGGSVNRRYYEPFGAHIKFNGTPEATLTHDIRHGFTGHPHDDDLGLIDMRGRIYSPSTRQFLTPDPLGRLGASPYSYVNNNPLNWIDPTGFTEEEPGGAWFSGFDTLFGAVPNAAIDMSSSLVTQVAAAVAAIDFPNGNDAPNSSGCPDGTGTAPRPCAAPGEAGCSPTHQREPQTIRQAPPQTFGDVVGRALMLNEPPDEIGPYAIAYHIKHGIVNPVRRWVANEPYIYLDADHNVRTSSIHRDYSHEMAPVLGEVALMLAPGANALAQSSSAKITGAIAARAEQIHGTLHPIAQVQRTTAVLRTSGGDIVAGGARDLAPIQKSMLGPGEIPAKLPGAHAEVTALTHAQGAGLTPQAMAVTRTICSDCAIAIEASGGTIMSPTTVIWP